MSRKMSKILIIYASRYGSTEQVANMIADALATAGLVAEVINVSDSPDIKDFDMVLLGSGIYAHRFLPEMETFIEEHRDILQACKLGMFGVAMRTETVYKNGRSFGGELILDKYSLDPAVKGMLHGRMDFAVLTDKDRAGLERFYVSIGLSEEQKADRRKLRDEISADECKAFAGAVLESLS